jgi:hypothetical protein
MNFAQWQSKCAPGAFRLFSLGRHALVEALRAAGLKAGDKVLLPEFICRDVLASLHAVDADVAWYPVAENLEPASSPESWPQARAILAVNYFGFPQPLPPFRAYASRTGAVLIEDNAHGFLSCDEDGRWLGMRGDAGIFSIRKSLPLADGAALVVSNQAIAGSLAEPVRLAGRGYNPQTTRKARLRAIPLAGIAAANASTSAVRLARWLRSGHAIPLSDENAEREIPYPPAAHSELMSNLASLDVDGEIERRRRLYLEAETKARCFSIAPIFSSLPPSVTPYGFPFWAPSDTTLKQMRSWAKRRGLELISWPDLPHAIEQRPAAWHRRLRLVNFL